MEKLVSQARRIAKKTKLKSRNFTLRHKERMITEKGRLTFRKIVTKLSITS